MALFPVLLLQCDVADEAAVRRTLATVGEAFGHLDALVNNAGTTAKWKVKDLESLDLNEWDRTFAVNVRGLFQVDAASYQQDDRSPDYRGAGGGSAADVRGGLAHGLTALTTYVASCRMIPSV